MKDYVSVKDLEKEIDCNLDRLNCLYKRRDLGKQFLINEKDLGEGSEPVMEYYFGILKEIQTRIRWREFLISQTQEKISSIEDKII